MNKEQLEAIETLLKDMERNIKNYPGDSHEEVQYAFEYIKNIVEGKIK